MAINWALFLIVIFAFLGIVHSRKPGCPNNKTYQCVPRYYCPPGLRSRTYFSCSATNDVCCEEKKIYYGVRHITNNTYMPGPFTQG